MKLTITDPSDLNPGTTGYYSLEIERNGTIEATVEVSPEYLADSLPDVEDPEDLAEFFEEAAAGARAMTDAVDDLE
ncbi:hypothetical protein [Halobacterium sp. KA-6]|uniref:hypothetical protein n=1 Tax=Halobacterium sp. KA-6 TaxID=2896368 RepID=UPI001E56BFC9|nr:hypothetical protein [Halobacterium sp. KA-6]MCD2202755.1 hypothetical protein [Halobacterium sp. KA-6]